MPSEKGPVMRILKSLLAASLLVAAPALAQSGDAALSDGGKKIVLDHMKQRGEQIEPLLQKKRALQGEFDALLTPATYDEAKLAGVMKEMQAVEAQIFDAMGGTMLTILKALPEADRAAFMKSLVKTPPKLQAGPGR